MIKNHEEMQYLQLLEECINQKDLQEDRTGTGTFGVIGRSMRFDLSHNRMPLLTTKKVYWKGVVEELLWFISGHTNSQILEDKGVNIWKGNTSREFLDNRGLESYPEKEIGPGYGFQWRNWNGDYDVWLNWGIRTGIDQFDTLINEIKNNPSSRRHVLCSWNVSAIPHMVLPPCHCLAQFFVRGNKLSCLLYQRSCDMFLGVPFNIASYALLTHMIAKETGLEADEFIWNGGDIHLYSNHINQTKEQISRTPYEFPTVELPNKSIYDITIEDIQLNDYQSHPSIKADMAV